MMITFSWRDSFAVSGRNSVMGTAELEAGSGSTGAIIVDKYTEYKMDDDMIRLVYDGILEDGIVWGVNINQMMIAMGH